MRSILKKTFVVTENISKFEGKKTNKIYKIFVTYMITGDYLHHINVYYMDISRI